MLFLQKDFLRSRWGCGMTLASTAALGLGIVLFLESLPSEEESPWTTESSAAAAHLEAGLEARAREDWQVAEENFEQALEEDPQLIVAHLQLAEIFPHRYGEEVHAALQEADLQRLTERERFLVRYWQSRWEDDPITARDVRRRFQESFPDDFFALLASCQEAWEAQEWDPAAACYANLAEQHPNWVEAHERLGYIALAQGSFHEAEKHFLTYRFIAPERPSAHISFADLLIVLGRYGEAEKALLGAWEIAREKGDGSCHVLRQLFRVRVLTGHLAEAERMIEKVEETRSCEGLVRKGWACGSRAQLHFMEGDFDASWKIFEEGCLEASGGFQLLAHRVAWMAGRGEEAREIEKSFMELRDLKPHLSRPESEWYEGAGMHMSGVRSAAQGDWRAAAEAFETADRTFPFWSPRLASFKFYNQLNLIYALRLAGDPEQAEFIEQEVTAINPKIMTSLRLPDFEEFLKARESEIAKEN